MRIDDQHFKHILYIQYPVKFKKAYTEVQALINSRNKVNLMIPAYTVVFGLCVCFTNIETQKIDRSTFLTYNLVLANF